MRLWSMHLPLDGLDFLTWLDLGQSILMYFKFCDYQKKKKQTRKNKENAVVCIS